MSLNNEGKADPTNKKLGKNGEWAKHLKPAGKRDANKRARKIAKNLKENGITQISMSEFKHLVELDEELEEMTGSGSAGAFATPHAFTRDGDEEEKDDKNAKLAHATVAKSINEATYREFKYDESMTPRQKVGHSIKKINGMLFRMERIINQNKKLKNELNMSPEQYWGSTHKKLSKVTERMIKVARALQELKKESEVEEVIVQKRNVANKVKGTRDTKKGKGPARIPGGYRGGKQDNRADRKRYDRGERPDPAARTRKARKAGVNTKNKDAHGTVRAGVADDGFAKTMRQGLKRRK